MGGIVGKPSFRNVFKKVINENEMQLGEKYVDIPKLTPAKWKQLFSTVDKLPGLIINVLAAPKDDLYAYVLNAIDIALDEVVEIVSILSEVDKEYIIKHVGLDDIVEYLTKTVKKNRLDSVVKNVKSLFPGQE